MSFSADLRRYEDVRAALVFMVVCGFGCSGGRSPAEPPHVRQARPVQADATPLPDASPPPPVVALRGAACAPDGVQCDPALSCLAWPRGYCASTCGEAGDVCPTGGGCTETWRAGELCLASCSTDSDCRATEGYRCDPTWKTCMLPNSGAILPRHCPAASALRDPAFGAVDALSTVAPGAYQLEPSAVVTDDGALTALYATGQRGDPGNPLGVSHLARGALEVEPFTSARLDHHDPWLARGVNRLYAVWLGDDDGAHQEIGFAVSVNRGVTWSARTTVHDPDDCAGAEDAGHCLDKPMVAAGPDPKRRGGEVVYVMYASGAGLRVRATRDAGATFTRTVTPLPGSHGNATVGSDGRLHVVMLSGGPLDSYGSANQQVAYAVSADGGATFGKPIAISRRDEMLPFFFANPSVAVDDRRGWLYVAYTRGGRDALWDVVISASKDQGKTWRRTRIGDDPPCAIHMVPNLAIDPTTGTLHVAWYDSRGGGRFAHAACPAGAATCAQLGAINDAPFAVLTTGRHGSTWLGEYESLIVDDKRRLLHAVWTQPVNVGEAEPKQAVSRIFHAVAKLPVR